MGVNFRKRRMFDLRTYSVVASCQVPLESSGGWLVTVLGGDVGLSILCLTFLYHSKFGRSLTIRYFV